MIPKHTTPLEDIYRNTAMRGSGLDYDRTLLFLAGGVFLDVFLYTRMCAFFTHRLRYRVYTLIPTKTEDLSRLFNNLVITCIQTEISW